MFNHIESSGSDMYTGYIAYKSESETLKIKSEKMYFYLQERRQLSDFGRYLQKKNLVKKQEHFQESCRTTLFSHVTGFGKYKTFLRYKKFLKEFELYKDQY